MAFHGVILQCSRAEVGLAFSDLALDPLSVFGSMWRILALCALLFPLETAAAKGQFAA